MLACQITAAAFGLVVALPILAQAQPGGESWSGYQRKGFYADSSHGDGRYRDHQRFAPQSQVSAGWFQRPYPYHLDYYRMRYGGSYAPYFGNLYGPANNYFYGSPYYGDYSPYYGYNGYPQSGFPGGYGTGGPPYCNGPAGYPYGPGPGGDAEPISPPVESDAADESPVVE